MATIQVFNEATGLTYNIDYSVESAVVNGNNTGYPNFYIKVSTTQKVIGTGATVPAEIVTTLSAPGYDVTTDMKYKSVVIMDKVAGGTLMSSSSSNSSSQTTGSWSSTVP